MYRIKLCFKVYLIWLCTIDFIKVEGIATNGQTSYYNPALGKTIPCSNICEPPSRSPQSCAYYCPHYETKTNQLMPAKKNKKSNRTGSWRFSFLSIPALFLMVTVTTYLVKKQQINQYVTNQIARCTRLVIPNQSAQITHDIELETIRVHTRDGSIQETAVGQALPEQQPLLDPRPYTPQWDQTIPNETGAYPVGNSTEVVADNAADTLVQQQTPVPPAFNFGTTEPLSALGLQTTSAQESHSVMENVMVTENRRLAGVPELTSVPEDNGATVKFENFKTVVVERRSESMDCTVVVHTKETRV